MKPRSAERRSNNGVLPIPVADSIADGGAGKQEWGGNTPALAAKIDGSGGQTAAPGCAISQGGKVGTAGALRRTDCLNAGRVSSGEVRDQAHDEHHEEDKEQHLG